MFRRAKAASPVDQARLGPKESLESLRTSVVSDVCRGAMSPGMPMDAADGRGRGRRTGAEALLLSRVDVSACFAARSVSRDRGFGASV